MKNQKILGLLFGVLAGAMWAVETIVGKVLSASLSFLQVASSEAFLRR